MSPLILFQLILARLSSTKPNALGSKKPDLTSLDAILDHK